MPKGIVTTTRRALLTRTAPVAAALAAGSAAGVTFGVSEPASAATATTLGNSTYLTPTGDTSGASDTSAIMGALASSYHEVVLLPGTFYINSTITLPPDSTLRGCGTATKVKPANGVTGAMFAFTSSEYNFTIRDLQIDGSGGPAVDVFAPAADSNRWWIENIDANNCNGWVVNVNFTKPMAGVVQGVQGSGNAGGIRIVGSSASSAQVTITNVNLQQCTTHEALYLQNAEDVTVTNFNASVAGPAHVPTVHLAGGCQAVLMSGLDVGVFPKPATAAVPVLLIETLSGGSNTEIDISASIFQEGGFGIEVNDASSRLRFRGVIAKENLDVGWLFSGTGTAILVEGCQANNNNQSDLLGISDVNVTSTAHVGLFNFAYCSTNVANSLSVSSGNHVSNVNSTNPGGSSVAGTPNGW